MKIRVLLKVILLYEKLKSTYFVRYKVLLNRTCQKHYFYIIILTSKILSTYVRGCVVAVVGF